MRQSVTYVISIILNRQSRLFPKDNALTGITKKT